MTRSTSAGGTTTLDFGTRTSPTSIIQNSISGNRLGVDIAGGSQNIFGNDIRNNRDHGIQVNVQGQDDVGTGQHSIGKLSQVPLGASRTTSSFEDETTISLTHVTGILPGDFIQYEGGNLNLVSGVSEVKVNTVDSVNKLIGVSAPVTLDEDHGP